MESRGLAGPWGPQPTGELPFYSSASIPVVLVRGERGSVRGRDGNLKGCCTVPPSSPGMRGAWDGIGQRVEGRLSPRPQAVDKHAGHQRPLQLRVGCRRSPVHTAVHGRGRRRRRGAVHAAQQAWVVEIRRRKHPLQSGVVPGFGQQLQAHCGLPLPFGSERKAVRAGCGCRGRSGHGDCRCPPSPALPNPGRPWGTPGAWLLPQPLWTPLRMAQTQNQFFKRHLLRGAFAAFPGPLLDCPPRG